MKLEPTHIQHYPIGGENALRVQFTDPNYKKHHNQNITLIGRMTGISTFDESGSVFVNVACDNGLRFTLSLDDINPLLRPMSDMYKERDGKIDIVELAKIAFRGNGYEFFKVKGKEVLFTSESAIITFRFYEETLRFSDQRNLLEMMEYLFANHYNVLNLPQEDWIDINTVKE